MKIQFATRTLVLGALALVSGVTLSAVGLRPAFAHAADCPYCSISVTQDTATQDNEVALKMGRKRIEYKCVGCAVAEAKTEFGSSDLSIHAPSQIKGKPVVLKRTGGKWNTLPLAAHFVSPAKLKHKTCQVQSRAFTSKAAAQAYAQKNGGSVLTLAQLVASAK